MPSRIATPISKSSLRVESSAKLKRYSSISSSSENESSERDETLFASYDPEEPMLRYLKTLVASSQLHSLG